MYCVLPHRETLDSYAWWSIYSCSRKYIDAIISLGKWELKYKLFTGCMAHVVSDFASKLETVSGLQIQTENCDRPARNSGLGKMFWDKTFALSFKNDILNIYLHVFHVKPFTFSLEICQFKIKGTSIYYGGGWFLLWTAVFSASAKC